MNRVFMEPATSHLKVKGQRLNDKVLLNKASQTDPKYDCTRRHLRYWITQCHLPPATSELVPPNPSQTD